MQCLSNNVYNSLQLCNQSLTVYLFIWYESACFCVSSVCNLITSEIHMNSSPPHCVFSMTVQTALMQHPKDFSCARAILINFIVWRKSLLRFVTGDVDGGDILRDYWSRLCHFQFANSNLALCTHAFIQYTSIYSCCV